MARLKDAVLVSAAVTLLAGSLEAAVQPQTQEKDFRSPGLVVPMRHLPLSALDGKKAAELQAELAGLGVTAESAFYDSIWQRWGSLFPSRPLLPGRGVRNTLSWTRFGVAGHPTDARIKAAAWEALTAYLEDAPALRLDTGELSRSPRLGVYDDGALIQIYAQRFLAGVPVRDSGLTAVINNGNLILLGLQNWGDAAPGADPTLTADDARTIVTSHAEPAVLLQVQKPHLEFVPFASGAGSATGDAGAAGAAEYGYRLVWVVDARSDTDLGTWEGLVDAQSGELLAFQDRNQYDARLKKIVGGVFPVSNDGVPPDGVEVPGFPMPFADVKLPDGSTVFTNTGGVVGCVQPTTPSQSLTPLFETTLSGAYVSIADNCGPIRERFRSDPSPAGDLDFGPGTDCVVPSGRNSPGDTHASRTGFYELNKIIEQARGYLPTNQWLRTPVTANMNLNQTCNAFWNGVAVNFYKDSGSQCRNTGQIAAIFDHEWGHGMDNNGVNPNITNPGESIADIHAILRLEDSCGGRGFFKTGNCAGYGDACTACSGVRDLDWARHRCALPHTLTWINSGFTVGQCNPAAPACPAGGGPCGHEVHCEGYPTAETAWDLFARDLQAPPFNLDANTALEIDTRLWYLGSQLVASWYQCTPPAGGCPATAGYMNVLAADDDNGSLADGTPHMTAIFAAFNRHEIACASPAPVNSGCVGGPTTAPVLTATALDQGASLTWTPVPGAARYAVYRTEGVRGCNFGKAKIGETAGLSFVDLDLMNGFAYNYAVLPLGATDACVGRMSACQQVTPAPGANLRTLAPGPVQAIGGDGDGILDNCETARLTVGVENNGAATLTNVRVLSAVSPTHPLTVPVTPLPAILAATLAPCGQATGTIDVTPHGMTFNGTFQVTLTITADQIAPQTRSVTFTATGVETDFANVATRTYDFNTGMQGWTVTSGTFTRVDAGGGDFYLASSSCLDGQCDVVRSPVIRLTGTSTLSLTQRYDTEIPTPIPYDRANVGVFELATGARTAVSPNGGKLYDLAPGAANGNCGTTQQAGWSADTDADCTPNAPFLSSTWSSSALNPGGVFTNRSAQLSVNYGTDPGGNGWGFHFDNVVLTNFLEAVPDAQACAAPPPDVSTRERVGPSPGRK